MLNSGIPRVDGDGVSSSIEIARRLSVHPSSLGTDGPHRQHEWVPTDEYAERVGATVSLVVAWIRSGNLDGVVDGSRSWVLVPSPA